MAMTPSNMLPLGTTAPGFSLPDPQGAVVSLDAFADSSALLVMFICNHCPFVKHVRDELAALGRDYQPRGVAVVGINSNDVENYPDDSPEKMREEVEKVGYTFSYLYDETQAVARAYRAACTPDFFLFDGDRKLYYRGQFDDSRPESDKPITGADLGAAIASLLEGKPTPEKQIPSAGCNIKWKAGQQPDYFTA